MSTHFKIFLYIILSFCPQLIPLTKEEKMQCWLCLLFTKEKARIYRDIKTFHAAAKGSVVTGTWQCCGNTAKHLKRNESKVY